MTTGEGSVHGRIVVGVDGSTPSKWALRWAARLAEVSGQSIDAVMAWEVPVTYGTPYFPADWRPDQDAEKELGQTVDAVFGPHRPLGLRLFVEEGNPAAVLLAHSRGADLLVVGSRGHGGFAGLLLGSVSANCAERSGCSVLVAHGDPVPVPPADPTPA